MRILIAEDSLTSRSLIAAALKKSGHEVVEVGDGAAAWEALQRPEAPMLAILDWMMPNLNGPDVVRLVRALPTDRPPYVILLSVKSDKTDIISGLECGANDYLCKPFDPGELRARVEVGRRLLETQAALADKVHELSTALEQIKTLRGILPICSLCKHIRDDQGYWSQLEEYVRAHTDTEFSHGICPACVKKYYSEYSDTNGDDS